jgi:hypothetical protein
MTYFLLVCAGATRRVGPVGYLPPKTHRTSLVKAKSTVATRAITNVTNTITPIV